MDNMRVYSQDFGYDTEMRFENEEAEYYQCDYCGEEFLRIRSFYLTIESEEHNTFCSKKCALSHVAESYLETKEY